MEPLLKSLWKIDSEEATITSIWCSFWSINMPRLPKDSTKFRTVSSTDCSLMCRKSNKKRSWSEGVEMPVKVKVVMKVKIPCKRPSLYSCKGKSSSLKTTDSFSSKFSNADNWRKTSHKCTCLKEEIWVWTDHQLQCRTNQMQIRPISYHRFSSRIKDEPTKSHFQK